MQHNTAQPYGSIPADEGNIWFALKKMNDAVEQRVNIVPARHMTSRG